MDFQHISLIEMKDESRIWIRNNFQAGDCHSILPKFMTHLDHDKFNTFNRLIIFY